MLQDRKALIESDIEKLKIQNKSIMKQLFEDKNISEFFKQVHSKNEKKIHFMDFILSSLVCSLLLFSNTKHSWLFEIWSDHKNTHDLRVSGQVSHSYHMQFEPVYDQLFAEFFGSNFENQLDQ